MDLDPVTQEELPDSIMMYSVRGSITDLIAEMLDYVITNVTNPHSLHLVNLGDATDICERAIRKFVLIGQIMTDKRHRWALTLDGKDHAQLMGIARGIKEEGVFIFKTRQEAIDYLLQCESITT